MADLESDVHSLNLNDGAPEQIWLERHPAPLQDPSYVSCHPSGSYYREPAYKLVGPRSKPTRWQQTSRRWKSILDNQLSRASEYHQATCDQLKSALLLMRKYPIVMFPTEILSTLLIISPLLGWGVASVIDDFPRGWASDFIIGDRQPQQDDTLSWANAIKMGGIGLYAAIHNTGLSAFGDFIPKNKSPESWREFDENPETADWGAPRRIANILKRGGFFALSHVSNETLTDHFAGYTNRYQTLYHEAVGTLNGLAYSAMLGVGMLGVYEQFPMFHESFLACSLGGVFAMMPFLYHSRAVALYGQALRKAELTLARMDGIFKVFRHATFIPQALPQNLGESISTAIGVLGSLSFYGLYHSLIGIEGDNMFEFLLLNSILLAPFTHKLTCDYYGKDIRAKALADIGIYFALNIVEGLCMGPHFDEYFKVAMGLASRGVIIAVWAYKVAQIKKIRNGEIPAPRSVGTEGMMGSDWMPLKKNFLGKG